MSAQQPPTLDIVFTRLDRLPPQLEPRGTALIVMPFIDLDMARRSALQLARRSGAGGQLVCIQDTDRIGFVALANAVFRRSTAQQFGYVAQDAFAGRDWLAIALAGLAAKDAGLLAYNDGKWGGALAAFGLVEQGWAAKNYGGDLFHPGYKRHYADVELTLLAMQERKFVFDPLAVLVEVDWEKETRGGVLDEDRILFHRRGQTGYDRRVRSSALRRLFK